MKQLELWSLSEYGAAFIKSGYKLLLDLKDASESEIRALGVTKAPDLARAMSMVERIQHKYQEEARKLDKDFVDFECIARAARTRARAPRRTPNSPAASEVTGGYPVVAPSLRVRPRVRPPSSCRRERRPPCGQAPTWRCGYRRSSWRSTSPSSRSRRSTFTSWAT